MRDFSAPHLQKVVHFGIWAEEGQDLQKGDRDAWNILCRAAHQCAVRDFRDDQNVIDALAWFEGRLIRPRPVQDYRKALGTIDATQRYFELSAALDRLKKGMGYS